MSKLSYKITGHGFCLIQAVHLFAVCCGIRLLAGTVSDSVWRRFCSQRTDAVSALEVSRWCAI